MYFSRNSLNCLLALEENLLLSNEAELALRFPTLSSLLLLLAPSLCINLFFLFHLGWFFLVIWRDHWLHLHTDLQLPSTPAGESCLAVLHRILRLDVFILLKMQQSKSLSPNLALFFPGLRQRHPAVGLVPTDVAASHDQPLLLSGPDKITSLSSSHS
jgi:hypothetical protein